MVVAEMYQKLDNFLVGGANVAVKGCNWTFGWGRADLADILNVASSVFILIEAPLLSPIAGLRTIGGHTKNRLLDKEDRKNRDIINPQVEEDRDELKRSLELYGGTGLVGVGLSDNLGFDFTDSGIGLLGLAASSVVMRTDYCAPRKNCIKRGLEKYLPTIPHTQ